MSKLSISIKTGLTILYFDPGYSLMFEVGNSTGQSCSRHADAIVVGLYPSRGFEIEGFEFKSSRSDWLQELKNPQKAEAVAKYCHRWWLVISDTDIMKEGELPAGWGLLVPKGVGDKLSVLKRAPVLNPVPVDSNFLAACIKAKTRDEESIERIKQIAFSKGLKEGRQKSEGVLSRDLVSAKEEIKNFKSAILDYKVRTGIDLMSFGYNWHYRDKLISLLAKIPTEEEARVELTRISEKHLAFVQDIKGLLEQPQKVKDS